MQQSVNTEAGKGFFFFFFSQRGTDIFFLIANRLLQAVAGFKFHKSHGAATWTISQLRISQSATATEQSISRRSVYKNSSKNSEKVWIVSEYF